MTEELDQSSGAVERLAEWLSKPIYDTIPSMGPQLTRFAGLVILSAFAAVLMGAIYLVP